MDRALSALKVSAEKVRRRRVVRLRAIATQACRMATNGQQFIDRVAEETGLKLQIISPQEEARLSVQGCLNLIDRTSDAALVVDVGGGSTELSWVELNGATVGQTPPIKAWLSIPVGVVTLAEHFPEGDVATEGWFRQMVDHVRALASGATTPAEPPRCSSRICTTSSNVLAIIVAVMNAMRPNVSRRSVFDLRSMRPGSRRMRNPSHSTSITGASHQPTNRPSVGVTSCSPAANSTAVAIGHRRSAWRLAEAAGSPAGTAPAASLTPPARSRPSPVRPSAER
jgi:hypothetical protein